MSVGRIDNAPVAKPMMEQEFRFRPIKKTLAGDITVAYNEPPVQVLDCNGSARNVTLPVAAAAYEGYMFMFFNISGTAVAATVKDAGVTIATVAQGKAAIVVCDGGTWRAMTGA